MRDTLKSLRQSLARHAYLTTFETVVAGGVLGCLCVAAVTAKAQLRPNHPLRAVVTIPAKSP